MVIEMNNARVTTDGPIASDGTLYLRPGVNLRTGEKDFTSAFGALDSLEVDVLTLASAIYACDLAFRRGRNEEITRSINLTVPLYNLTTFDQLHEDILLVLYFLSSDAWHLTFIQRKGKVVDRAKLQKLNPLKILLFSGGLDSYAASEKYGQLGNEVRLFSHVTGNRRVQQAQELLFDCLTTHYRGLFTRTAIHTGESIKTKKGSISHSIMKERTRNERVHFYFYYSRQCVRAA
jgi:hypothetical protein